MNAIGSAAAAGSDRVTSSARSSSAKPPKKSDSGTTMNRRFDGALAAIHMQPKVSSTAPVSALVRKSRSPRSFVASAHHGASATKASGPRSAGGKART